MRTMRNVTWVSVLAGLTLISAGMDVSAQDEPVAPEAPAAEPAPAPPPAAPPPPVEATAQVQTPPPVLVAPEPAPAAAESDHDSVVGSFAVGYLGRRSLSIGSGVDPETGALSAEEVNAPVIGMRYWLNDMIGIDAGLGFLVSGGTAEVELAGESEEADLQGYTAFILHAGVPISLADTGHFSFQIVPEANVGFGSSTIDGGDGGEDIDLSGFHLDIGARAGAEIHFGFIDIPQLSLQGSIGARFAYDRVGGEVGDFSANRSTHSFGTNVGDNPWNIFTSNVAALYYF